MRDQQPRERVRIPPLPGFKTVGATAGTMCRGLSLSCQATGASEMNNIKSLRTSKKRLMQNLCTRRTSEVCSCRSFRMYQEVSAGDPHP